MIATPPVTCRVPPRFSFVCASAPKKRRIDAFFKPKNAEPKAEDAPKSSAYDLPRPKNGVSTNCDGTVTPDNVVQIRLPKNRVGIWFLELDRKPSGALGLVALERFDFYNKPDDQAASFDAWVDKMPKDRVALISITDTAMAKTRPLPRLVYETLQKLGAPTDIEPIGYRMPFALIGVKGAPPGSATLALDKTKIILRLEAALSKPHTGPLTIDGAIERFDITEAILDAANDQPPERAADASESASEPDSEPEPA